MAIEALETPAKRAVIDPVVERDQPGLTRGTVMSRLPGLVRWCGKQQYADKKMLQCDRNELKHRPVLHGKQHLISFYAPRY